MTRLAALLLAATLAAGCSAGRGSNTESTADVTSIAADAKPTIGAPAGTGKVHKLASGLVYVDMLVGNGKMADPGLTISVHYSGWLTDGTPFDSSVERGQPIQFILGTGRVIQGWDQGIKGMRVGGKRKLTIPPDLAYGAEGDRVIPPNATLIFDVELLGVK